ncbi:MAG TPA: subclass B3 metallo-beta-lactamase [Rhizomicrobium sp.]|nr:subclass B3 metallo-beta-lactamase [Rhizomicrobium sp.]
MAAFGLALLWTAAAGAAPAFDVAAWDRPMAPFHVAGPIYYVGTAELGVYLIATPGGEVLIDGGMQSTVPQIEANIRTLGFDIREVRLILNSHAHFDHAGGIAQLKRDSGARFDASAGDTPILERGNITWGPSAGVHFAPVEVDRIVRDGEAVDVGGARLVAHLTPGHTPGCTTWTLPFVENGARHTAVFYCSTTVAGNPLVGNTAYPAIVADYRASFAKLKTLKADTFLAPHAGMFHPAEKLARRRPGGPNPFIDPEEFQAFVAASEKDFEAELARQRQAAGK